MSQPLSNIPLEIDQPGRYHLTASLHSDEGDFAIKVSASDVALDLRGHSLSFDNGTTILLCGERFTLSHGTVRGTPLAIASEPSFRSHDCHFHDLHIFGGLFAAGDLTLVHRCKVEGGSYGIRLGKKSQVEGCEVEGAYVGIEVGAGSEVRGCQVRECEDGVYAFGTREAPSFLEKLVVYECAGLGIRLDGPGELYRCEAHNNGKEHARGGIHAGPASSVKECEAYGNIGGDIIIVTPCELTDNQTSDGTGRRSDKTP
jgi:parallel beta helix pectate lyase-like protein